MDIVMEVAMLALCHQSNNSTTIRSVPAVVSR